MPPVKSFAEPSLKSLAEICADFGSCSTIDLVLIDKDITDRSGQLTKWKRLYWIFDDLQHSDGCANRVLDLVSSLLEPARFVGENDKFDGHRERLNKLLALHGLQFGADGKFRSVQVAETLPEADRRAPVIRGKLSGRRIHPEVSKYCRAELIQHNYYHAIFEAVKGLRQRIRNDSGVDGDSASLVDAVFSGDAPVLAINTLQTDAERQQQRGLAALLKGCFAAIRNPIAHEPKTMWQDEDHVADYFSLISLLHYKLDRCVPTSPLDHNR